MHMQHEFPLDDIFLCSDSLCVFHDGLPGSLVGINEIGYIRARTFEKNTCRTIFEIFATLAVLCRYQQV